VADQLAVYVYLLIDPSDDRVFYVGKGRGNRCFQHIAEAEHTSQDSIDDYPKLDRIRSIGRTGRVVIRVLRHGLTDEAALLVESAAIDLLSPDGLTNRVVGHGWGLGGFSLICGVNPPSPRVCSGA
jgi:uncharacterized protein